MKKMKKFSHYIFLSCLLAFTIVVNAQKPTEVTREAAELMNKGNIRGAIAVLDKGIEKKKDLFEIYRMRSFLRPMIGDFNGALSDLSSAIEIKPDSAALYEQRAMMRLNLRQDWSLIIKDLDSAISYGRKLEKIYALRASARRQTGDEEGAISDYQTAIGLRPDYAQAHVGLASIYLLKRDDDKAVSIYEQFLQTFENSNGKPHKLKGEIVAESSVRIQNENLPKDVIQEQQTVVIIRGVEGGRMPNSPEDAEKMSDNMEQSKNIALAYANLGSIYERKGEIEKAIAAVAKAIAIDPNDFVAYNTRGKIRIKQNDPDGAISDFNRAIKAMPSMSESYLGRGIALLLQGKEAEAQKDFDKYLQIFPNGKMYLEKRIEEAKQKLQK